MAKVRVKVPCKDCENRKSECHISCERYKQFHMENEQIKKNRRKDMINRSTIFRANNYN